MLTDAEHAQVNAAVDAIRGAIAPDALVGIALYGSAVGRGLRPDSDLDLFVIVRRRMTAAEKHRLIQALKPISRRSHRPVGWRPLEVTVVAEADMRPWRRPPVLELQYGEWLSDEELASQADSGPIENPDLGVVIAMVRTEGRSLHGPTPADVLDPVPNDEVDRAIMDALPALLADLEDDTRNVLLTLARMWSTLADGGFRPKDEAAEWAIAKLPEANRPLLERARDGYRDGGWDEWADDSAAVRALADRMVAEIRAIGSPGTR